MSLSFSSSSYDVDGGLIHHHHHHRPSFGSPAAPYEFYNDSNGGLLPLPSSFPPAEYYDLSRSSSSHSLPLHLYARPEPTIHHHPPPSYSSPPSSSSDYLNFHAAPVRRALSAGDLQRTHGLAENYGQEGGGGVVAGRVGRYSAEERKERIERYRSKRNQRNFHKKITYACRKTLADSRPRVRGRFARNGETEAEMAAASGYGSSGMNQSYGLGGEWWSQMLATDDEEDLYYDGDVLVSLAAADVFAMNLLS